MEEKIRIELEQKLQDEVRKQDQLQKKIALENLARTMLKNSTFVGFVSFFIVMLLPLGFIGNYILVALITLISGGYVAYRLINQLPNQSLTRTLLICAAGGSISSLPIILGSLRISTSGWMVVLELFLGILGGIGFAYVFIQTNIYVKTRNAIIKVWQEVTSFFVRVLNFLLRMFAPLIVSYVFGLFSWILVYKQEKGFATEITQLVVSFGTEMALFNGVFMYVMILLFGTFQFLRQKNSASKFEIFEGVGCTLLLLALLARISFLALGFTNKMDPSSYYWVGIVFNPLYLVSLDFLDSSLFLIVFLLQLIPFYLFDVLNLSFIGYVVDFFMSKSKGVTIVNDEKLKRNLS